MVLEWHPKKATLATAYAEHFKIIE